MLWEWSLQRIYLYMDIALEHNKPAVALLLGAWSINTPTHLFLSTLHFIPLLFACVRVCLCVNVCVCVFQYLIYKILDENSQAETYFAVCREVHYASTTHTPWRYFTSFIVNSQFNQLANQLFGIWNRRWTNRFILILFVAIHRFITLSLSSSILLGVRNVFIRSHMTFRNDFQNA